MTTTFSLPSYQIGDRYFSAGKVAAEFVQNNPAINNWEDGTLGAWPVMPRILYKAALSASSYLPVLLGATCLYLISTGKLNWLTGLVYGTASAATLYLLLIKLAAYLATKIYPDVKEYALHNMQFQISELLTIPMREVTVQLVAKLAQYHAFTSYAREKSRVQLELQERRKDEAAAKAKREAEEREKAQAAQRKKERQRQYAINRDKYFSDDETSNRTSNWNNAAGSNDYSSSMEDINFSHDTLDFSSSSSDDDLVINPASGQPMIGGFGGVDYSGHHYGFNNF